MGLKEWLSLAFAVTVFGVSIARVIGPRTRHKQTRPDSKVPWRSRPRAPLRPSDWNPHELFPFFPALMGVIGTIAGIQILVSPHGLSRIVGVLDLVVSTALSALVILHARRPVVRESGSLPVSRQGNGDEVDRFLATVETLSPDEIRRATFSSSRPGYDESTADNLLARWWAAGNPPHDGRHRMQ